MVTFRAQCVGSQKKCLDLKGHPFLLPRDAACPDEFLQHFVSIFKKLQMPVYAEETQNAGVTQRDRQHLWREGKGDISDRDTSSDSRSPVREEKNVLKVGVP